MSAIERKCAGGAIAGSRGEDEPVRAGAGLVHVLARRERALNGFAGRERGRRFGERDRAISA